ncbi:MAG: substrate-binding domain-containing protein [Verrucomicrobiae bacterium]|nr:substrate-binding domain-containing protein [Verrucomicrobiae bacterium]
MKKNLIKTGCLAIGLCLGAFQAQALDGAVVIANSSVAADSLSADALKDILTGKTKYWDGGQAVIITILPDKTDAALQQACGMDTSAFKTFWQRLAFSGRGQEPKKAADAAELVQIVATTKGAIAIVPADAALTGVKKLEIK